MTTAQVVETSVTVNNNSPIQDYVHPDDQTLPTLLLLLLLLFSNQSLGTFFHRFPYSDSISVFVSMIPCPSSGFQIFGSGLTPRETGFNRRAKKHVCHASEFLSTVSLPPPHRSCYEPRLLCCVMVWVRIAAHWYLAEGLKGDHGRVW